MRFMVQFWIPTQEGNDAVRSGKIAKVMKQLGEDFKPEAMYFYPDDGMRAGAIFFQTDNPALGAAMGERMWLGLQARVKITPVMNGEELGKGLTEMEKILKNYG